MSRACLQVILLLPRPRRPRGVLRPRPCCRSRGAIGSARHLHEGLGRRGLDDLEQGCEGAGASGIGRGQVRSGGEGAMRREQGGASARRGQHAARRTRQQSRAAGASPEPTTTNRKNPIM